MHILYMGILYIISHVKVEDLVLVLNIIKNY